MSQTMTPGRVDASDWTYVATIMSMALEDAASKLQFTVGSIPEGVLLAACEFFRLVVEGAQRDIPADPIASAANYGIAARALRAAPNHTPRDRDELNRALLKLSALVNGLDEDHTFSNAEAADVRELAQFFARIAAAGETKAYEKYVTLTL